MGRAWTEYQDEFVRAWWQRAETREIAELMDRETREVSIRAWELGAAKHRPDGYLSADEEAELRTLAGEGYCLTEIGRRLGIERHFLRDAMRRLGIVVNRKGPCFGEHKRVGYEKQLRTLGISSSSQLRVLAYRRFAAARGWPADLAPRQVQILDALYEQGPMGRRELCEAIGMPWKGVRKSMTGTRLPGGSYLADLILRGFVFAVRKGLVRPGMAACDLYSLSPEIVRGDPTTWPAHTSEATRRSRSRRSTSRSSPRR